MKYLDLLLVLCAGHPGVDPGRRLHDRLHAARLRPAHHLVAGMETFEL